MLGRRSRLGVVRFLGVPLCQAVLVITIRSLLRLFRARERLGNPSLFHERRNGGSVEEVVEKFVKTGHISRIIIGICTVKHLGELIKRVPADTASGIVFGDDGVEYGVRLLVSQIGANFKHILGTPDCCCDSKIGEDRIHVW